jgi:hypothetical protein
MAQTVVGMFQDQGHVEMAINELRDLNYDPTHFSVVMRDMRVATDIQANTGAQVANDTAQGALIGGVLAGVAGLLVGLGIITIPGIGALFVAGPIASALGLTGAAATTTSAAVTGAVAGGLVGALASIGFSQEDAQVYEERIRGGGILLIVPAQEQRVGEVQGIMTKHMATDIRSLELRTDVKA